MILRYLNLIKILINRTFFHLTLIFKKIIFIFMSDNLFEIDSAMNMIKEEIIKELSESVSKQNKNSYYQQTSSKNLTFSDKTLD